MSFYVVVFWWGGGGCTDIPVQGADVSTGFQKSHSGGIPGTIGGGMHNVHSLRFISGVTPAELLKSGFAANPVPNILLLPKKEGIW